MSGRTVKVRVLACPHCGAKLRWNRDAPIIECRYCQTHVVVETGKRTTEATDVVSVAGPRPPVVIGIVAVSAVAVAGITVAARHEPSPRAPTTNGPVKTSTIAELIATPLAATAAEVAKRHGIADTDGYVAIQLSDGPFSEAAFAWDKSHPEHVQSIMLRAREEHPDLTQVVTRAKGQLGRRLHAAATGGFQFQAKHVSFSISDYVQIMASTDGDDAWKPELELMWRVLQHAALGTNATLDDAARRDVLNLAYPVTVLNQIGMDVTVDDAAAEVHRIAPAADSDGAQHTIGLDHPWFDRVVVSWDNKANGAWTGVTLYFADDFDFAKQHEAFVACVEPALGKHERHESDHLANTFSLQFRGRGGRPWTDVSAQTVQFYPHYTFGDPATAEGIHTFVTALAGCGSREANP